MVFIRNFFKRFKTAAKLSAAFVLYLGALLSLCLLCMPENTVHIIFAVYKSYPVATLFFGALVEAISFLCLVPFFIGGLLTIFMELFRTNRRVILSPIGSMLLGLLVLLVISNLLLGVGESSWHVYTPLRGMLYSFMLALCICTVDYRASYRGLYDILAGLDCMSWFYDCSSLLEEWFCCVFSLVSSFFVSFRESFADIPMADVGKPESMNTRVQIVGSLGFETRVLLLTLVLTVYHGGKRPKNKKTVGAEFGILSVTFPHVTEGITSEHLNTAHSTYLSQAGLIGALGTFYVVYCLFALAVMQVLVVGNSGAKSAPSSAALYLRVDSLFKRASRRSSTRSTFSLSGQGYLAYKKDLRDKESNSSLGDSPAASGQKSGKAARSSRRKTASKDS